MGYENGQIDHSSEFHSVRTYLPVFVGILFVDRCDILPAQQSTTSGYKSDGNPEELEHGMPEYIETIVIKLDDDKRSLKPTMGIFLMR